MAKFIDQLKEPVVIGLIVFAIVASAIIEYFLNQIFLSVFVGVFLAGVLYALYSDYIEKQRIKEREASKEEELRKRKAEQAKIEKERGKCISCLEPLPEGASECPKCGFKVKHYNIDA